MKEKRKKDINVEGSGKNENVREREKGLRSSGEMKR